MEDKVAIGRTRAHPVSQSLFIVRGVDLSALVFGVTYLAHSSNSHGRPHLLAQHLEAAQRLATAAAGSARWAREAGLAGQLHDLGKYGDLFQARLRGKESGLDHWSAGAYIAASDRSLVQCFILFRT